MEGRRSPLTAADRLFLERACELAARAIGDTAPNPPVGAVIVREGRIVGEGYHHRAGDAHAEAEALAQAGAQARGATLYVTLEPCNHFGKTPPCSRTVIDAGIRRVVIGTADPNPKTAQGGIAMLRSAGLDVCIADSVPARSMIEPFAHAIQNTARPYVSLKMASSVDGYIATQGGRQQWLTGEQSSDFVRDLRIAHDAVMVGAGTVRVDDPQLTVRPAHHRLRPYTRVIVCETDTVPVAGRVFSPQEGYARTLVLAPGANKERFFTLRNSADVIFVGERGELDLSEAMRALREHGIQSVLCEGGPTLGGGLFAAGLVDRFYWLIAPVSLAAPQAVPVLNVPEGAHLPSIAFDSVERLGPDLLLGGVVKRV